MRSDIYQSLETIVGSANILKDEPMSKHTTFRVGGAADIFIRPTSIQQIQDIIAIANQYSEPYFIMGNGSNLIVSDKGYRGIVIQIFKNLGSIQFAGQRLTASAGASLAVTAKEACKNGLTGLEFAGGIPGTIGGAISMNAGAYGSEMKDVVVNATVLDQQGRLIHLTKDELELGYRTSIISKKGYIVLDVTLELEQGEEKGIQEKMREFDLARKTKQPLEYPSAGSTFKRPEGYFAGKLIQDAGLRGYRIGDAQISEKHCGFVINRQNATAADILQLIKDVQGKVYDLFKIKLETEVRVLGEIS